MERFTKIISVTKSHNGPIVHVFERRLHHGLSGVFLVITGTAMIIHDWKDKWWSPKKQKF